MKGSITLLSWHVFESDRRAGMHFLAAAFRSCGYEVNFVSAPISVISQFRHDSRLKYTTFKFNKFYQVDGINCYKWKTVLHPFSTRCNFVDRLLSPVWKVYADCLPENIRDIILRSAFVIVESSAWLIVLERLFEKYETRMPPVTYRVSDDIKGLGLPFVVEDAEVMVSSRAAKVSVPSESLSRELKMRGISNAIVERHGITKSAFDSLTDCSPYKKNSKNAIFVGLSLLDINFLKIVCDATPYVDFHIFGYRKPIDFAAANVIFYGEVPASYCIPFIKWADIGLAILRGPKNIEVFTDSLKIIQYTYCRLPIIAPKAFGTKKKYIFLYDYDDKSTIVKAVAGALKFDRENFDDISNVLDWRELALRLIKNEAESKVSE